MKKESGWTKGVSQKYDILNLHYYSGEVTCHPEFENLKLKLPGTVYEIKPEIIKHQLRINYCYEITNQTIDLDQIFTQGIINLQNDNQKAVIIGMGLTGFSMAGFNHIGSDGNHVGHMNDHENDYDFLAATENCPHQNLQDTVNISVLKLQQIFLPSTRLQNVSWEDTNWNNGAPKGKVIYERGRGNYTQTFNPIEFGHINRGSLQKAVNDALKYANPFKSNVIGAPLYLLVPNENGEPKHYIWQPVDFDPHAPEHEIDLTCPEDFASNIRCLKQILRGLHYVYLAQAAAKYYEPAERNAKLANEMLQVFSAAVKKYEGLVTPEIIVACKKRLATCIYRSNLIARNHQKSWHPEDHVFSDFPDAETFFAKYLDQIGWGEAVLGQKVENYIHLAGPGL